jgi:poly A polymerase
MNKLFKQGIKIANILEDNGYEAYIVGGSVRDLLLNRQINDIDITTNATPEEIEKVYKDFKQIDIGKKFGTIKILDNNDEFEITTFRSEKGYSDGRHPDEVSFTKSIYDDLKRRDLTINSIAFRNGEIYDPFNGKKDIKNKVIKAVGNPEERIKEDALRILRAVRFSIQLDFKIDNELKEAIKRNKNRLDLVSKERINEELNKMLIANPFKTIKTLKELDILNNIFTNIEIKNINKLKNIDKDIHEILAIMFLTNNKDKVENTLRDLKYSNNDIEVISQIVENYRENYSRYELRKMIFNIGIDNSKKTMEVFKIINGKENDNFEEILNNNFPKSRKEIAISGDDIKKLGFKEGKEIGSILKVIEEEILKGNVENDKEKIKNFILERIFYENF